MFTSFLESQRGGVSRPETFTKRCVRKRVKNVGFGKLQKNAGGRKRQKNVARKRLQHVLCAARAFFCRATTCLGSHMNFCTVGQARAMARLWQLERKGVPKTLKTRFETQRKRWLEDGATALIWSSFAAGKHDDRCSYICPHSHAPPPRTASGHTASRHKASRHTASRDTASTHSRKCTGRKAGHGGL